MLAICDSISEFQANAGEPLHERQPGTPVASLRLEQTKFTRPWTASCLVRASYDYHLHYDARTELAETMGKLERPC